MIINSNILGHKPNHSNRQRFGQLARFNQLEDHDALPLPVASPGNNHKNIGIFLWDRNPVGVIGFEQWAGIPIRIAEDFQPFYSDWELMISNARAPHWTGWVNDKASFDSDGNKTRRVAFAFPVFPAFRNTWESDAGGYDGARGQTKRALEYFQAAANGEFNHYYQELGQMLIHYGLENSIIRFGHEFDGNWYAWSISIGPGGGTERAQLYAAAFRQFVTTLRYLDGENFTFCWNPNAAFTTNPDLLLSAWPGGLDLDNQQVCQRYGRPFVDYISFDQYDQFYGGTHYNQSYYDGTPELRRIRQEAVWNHLYNHATGLKWFGEFSKKAGVPLAIGEWGLWFPESGHEHRGGGDNAYWIRRMHNFINDYKVAWHVYFNFGDVSHSIYNTNQHPMASREFLRLINPSGAPEHYPYGWYKGLQWHEIPRHVPPAIWPGNIKVPAGHGRHVLHARDAEFAGQAELQPDPWSLSGVLADLWKEPAPEGTAIFFKAPADATGFALAFQAWVQNTDHPAGGNDRFVNVYVNNQQIALNCRLPALGRGWIDSYDIIEFNGVEVKAGDEISFHIPAGIHSQSLWAGVRFDYVVLFTKNPTDNNVPEVYPNNWPPMWEGWVPYTNVAPSPWVPDRSCWPDK